MNAVPPRHLGHRPALVSGVLTAVTVAVLTGVLTLVLAACSGSDDADRKPTGPASASAAVGGGTVSTVTTIDEVSGGRLGDARRVSTKKLVGGVVDDFLDGAYLGTFPRTDYTAAFQDFTPQAARLAEQQLDVLSNQPVSDQITSASATRRRVRLSVFAPQGLARGITARFVLDFTTAGDLTEDQRVQGQLYLQKRHGTSWQVFGFKVSQPVAR